MRGYQGANGDDKCLVKNENTLVTCYQARVVGYLEHWCHLVWAIQSKKLFYIYAISLSMVNSIRQFHGILNCSKIVLNQPPRSTVGGEIVNNIAAIIAAKLKSLISSKKWCDAKGEKKGVIRHRSDIHTYSAEEGILLKEGRVNSLITGLVILHSRSCSSGRQATSCVDSLQRTTPWILRAHEQTLEETRRCL